VDPDLPIYEVETMETLVDRRIGGFAVIGYLMGVFALLSLLLGAVGIYGVTAYATGQRTSEIGVRLAMGAERNDVVRMVVREGAARAVVGLVVGLGLALLMGGALAGVLIGVGPRDPMVFGGVVLTLATVSLVGLWLPARRASRVDPVRALGAE
jgi:putative ABC transport system permease protein